MAKDSAGAAPVFALVMVVSFVVNLTVHIWTVVLAYRIKGVWPAVATFVLPAIAECYWAYMLWDTMRYYSIIAVTVVVVFGILKFIAKASDWAEE
jgi:intracellular septation protein A